MPEFILPEDAFQSGPVPKSDGFVKGYETALAEFETQEEPRFINPFASDTDEYRGYEEAAYDLTQK